MSQYNGCYVRVVNSPALWAVDEGQRRPVASPAEMYEIGLRPVRVLLEDELAAIPLIGQLPENDEEE